MPLTLNTKRRTESPVTRICNCTTNSIKRIDYQISSARMTSENLNKEPCAVVNAEWFVLDYRAFRLFNWSILLV